MLTRQQILTLLQLPKIGRKLVFQIVTSVDCQFHGLADLKLLLKKAAQGISRLRIPSPDEFAVAIEQAKEIENQCSRSGIQVITFSETDFPERLRRIPDPPVVLYTKGDSSILHRQLTVAVIGTRAPTEWGKRMATRFGKRFAEKGFVVISGLAIGCDEAAHRGCLDERGKTVAVLAHGLDTVYPAQHRELASRIVDERGCLISEYPPGAKSRPSFFVERDRLQSGLSIGVVVVETDVKGGTMHTVQACLNQKKILGCLVHPERLSREQKVQGNKLLLREKTARPIGTETEMQTFIFGLETSLREDMNDRKKPFCASGQLDFFGNP